MTLDKDFVHGFLLNTHQFTWYDWIHDIQTSLLTLFWRN